MKRTAKQIRKAVYNTALSNARTKRNRDDLHTLLRMGSRRDKTSEKAVLAAMVVPEWDFFTMEFPKWMKYPKVFGGRRRHRK